MDTEPPPFGSMPRVIGGRYGLASKEFTPADVRAVFDELARFVPKRRFTVGITDDVTNLSLDVDRSFAVPLLEHRSLPPGSPTRSVVTKRRYTPSCDHRSPEPVGHGCSGGSFGCAVRY